MKIKIIGTVEHDGKRLEAGDSVNLPDRVARELVAAGAAELDGKQKAAPTPAEGGTQRDSEADASLAPHNDSTAGEQEGQQ